MKRLLESTPIVMFAILVITTVVGWVDWVAGHELSVLVLYFVPVGLAAWYLGTTGAVIESAICAAFWFGADAFSGHVHSTQVLAVANTLVRLCAFLCIGLPTQRIRQLLRAEREQTELLRRALAEIAVLEGILPICAVCKKIRDGEGHWVPMERYITAHSGTSFSHGYCSACAKTLMEEAGLEETEGE